MSAIITERADEFRILCTCLAITVLNREFQGLHRPLLSFIKCAMRQTWGQFHYVSSISNSTQFHLVNSTSNLSIPIVYIRSMIVVEEIFLDKKLKGKLICELPINSNSGIELIPCLQCTRLVIYVFILGNQLLI